MTQVSPSQTPVPVVRGSADLDDDPINPDWIVEGHPRARVLTWVTSPDATTESFVWDCTAGTFRWYFAVDETVHIIDGSVTISSDGTDPVTLRVGDAAYFRAGSWSLWTVEEYVRKHAVLRVPVPTGLHRLVNGLGRRRYRLR